MIEAVDHLAAAHERAKKPLIAVDLRTGNIGRMGVMWVETTTALDALRAAHSVMAVAHAALVEALEEARAVIADERESMVECATMPPEHDVATLDPMTKPYVEEYDRVIATIDAALAKAGGEQ